MSFSKRGSKWANSALVVGVECNQLAALADGWEDMPMRAGREALVGVQFQQVRRARTELPLCMHKQICQSQEITFLSLNVLVLTICMDLEVWFVE